MIGILSTQTQWYDNPITFGVVIIMIFIAIFFFKEMYDSTKR